MKRGDLCYVVRGPALGRIVRIVDQVQEFSSQSMIWQAIGLRGQDVLCAVDADLLSVMPEGWDDPDWVRGALAMRDALRPAHLRDPDPYWSAKAMGMRDEQLRDARRRFLKAPDSRHNWFKGDVT